MSFFLQKYDFKKLWNICEMQRVRIWVGQKTDHDTCCCWWLRLKMEWSGFSSGYKINPTALSMNPLLPRDGLPASLKLSEANCRLPIYEYIWLNRSKSKDRRQEQIQRTTEASRLVYQQASVLVKLTRHCEINTSGCICCAMQLSLYPWVGEINTSGCICRAMQLSLFPLQSWLLLTMQLSSYIILYLISYILCII